MTTQYQCCQCDADVTAQVLQAWAKTGEPVVEAYYMTPEMIAAGPQVKVKCPNGHWCAYPPPPAQS